MLYQLSHIRTGLDSIANEVGVAPSTFRRLRPQDVMPANFAAVTRQER
jgi:hypothetical protein